MLTCYVCKIEVPSGSNFCPDCGKPVASPAVSAVPESTQQTNDERSFSWKTVGRVASIVALLGFTMPWVSCMGSVSSGIDVANRNEFVWLFPISVIAALVMLFTKPASIAQMKKIYRYVAGCGIASTVIVSIFILQVVWQLMQMDSEMRQFVGIHLGLDFSLLGAAALLVAGVKAYRSVSVSDAPEGMTLNAKAPPSIPLFPR